MPPFNQSPFLFTTDLLPYPIGITGIQSLHLIIWLHLAQRVPNDVSLGLFVGLEELAIMLELFSRMFWRLSFEWNINGAGLDGVDRMHGYEVGSVSVIAKGNLVTFKVIYHHIRLPLFLLLLILRYVIDVNFDVIVE